MSEFMVSVLHVDPMEEERCLLRFIWSGPTAQDIERRTQELRWQLIAKAEEAYDCDLENPDDVEIRVWPLEEFLGFYRREGEKKTELLEEVRRYAFVQEGAEVYWEDPDGGSCSGPKLVKECSYYYNEDSTVVLSELDGSGETEVYYSELKPKES